MFSQNINIFKIPLLGLRFGNNSLILSLLPQKYPIFQNNTLGIQFQQRQFNPIAFASKVSIFKIPLLGFGFGNDHLILLLLHKKYQVFQNTSLGIQILQRPFNPIAFASKVSKFSKYLSWDSNLATTV